MRRYHVGQVSLPKNQVTIVVTVSCHDSISRDTVFSAVFWKDPTFWRGYMCVFRMDCRTGGLCRLRKCCHRTMSWIHAALSSFILSGKLFHLIVMKPSHGHPDHIWDYAAMQNVQIYTWDYVECHCFIRPLKAYYISYI